MLALPAGVLAVHQLRYLLAYGAQAGAELRSHGDRYVSSVALLAGLLLAVAVLSILARALSTAREGRPGGGDPRRSLWMSWLVLAVVLLVGFCLLEAVEMWFEPGHPGGLAGVFASGGWWAVPASLCVSALMTAVTRGGRRLLRIVLARRLTRRRARPANAPRQGEQPHVPLSPPLARRAAGRAPPLRAPVTPVGRTHAA